MTSSFHKLLHAYKVLLVPTITELTDLKSLRTNLEDDPFSGRMNTDDDYIETLIMDAQRPSIFKNFERTSINYELFGDRFRIGTITERWAQLLGVEARNQYLGVPHAFQEGHFWDWLTTWMPSFNPDTKSRSKERRIDDLPFEAGVLKSVDASDINNNKSFGGKSGQQHYSTRKRKLIDDDESIESSKPKLADDDDHNSRTKNERGFTKNECICVPFDRKPDYSLDPDAKITVEDWRLHSVQSPIELIHDETNEYDHFEPLEFHGHWAEEGEAAFTNNGFTATLTFQNRDVPILMGGPLHEDKYIFEQLHFHWSDDDHSGCEHIFEGKAYSMEAHAVHYNSKYDTFSDAVDKHDGLAVVAFFLQATDDFENPCFKKLSEAVKDIVKINTSTSVRSDCLTWIKDGAQCKGYYTYQGSLTTEPYFESVTWIIYPKPIHISREQVQNFRNMKSTPCEKHNIVNNVRPIQTPKKKLDILFARSHKSSE